MTAHSLLKEAKQLSPRERIRLAHSILKSIEHTSQAGSLTPAQRQELRRRKMAFKANPSQTITWDELKKKLRPRHA